MASHFVTDDLTLAECMATPLFPATGGGVANKAAVVSTFEAIGKLLGQPLIG